MRGVLVADHRVAGAWSADSDRKSDFRDSRVLTFVPAMSTRCPALLATFA